MGVERKMTRGGEGVTGNGEEEELQGRQLGGSSRIQRGKGLRPTCPFLNTALILTRLLQEGLEPEEN